MFGLLVCRRISNKNKMLGHCRDRLNNKKEYIIVLDDKDMENIANIKNNDGNEGIDDYMEVKIEEIED